jgi:hypothetical protein
MAPRRHAISVIDRKAGILWEQIEGGLALCRFVLAQYPLTVALTWRRNSITRGCHANATSRL